MTEKLRHHEIRSGHFRRIACICLFFVLLITGGCSAAGSNVAVQTDEVLPLPEILSGKSFVFDELETGEGTALYTLVFEDNNYKLYEDNGKGIIASGAAEVFADRSLSLKTDGEEIKGSYSGSDFEEPYVVLNIFGKESKFVPATDTTEYVYLSYLGLYENSLKDAVLILERWNEFYLYEEGKLIRGTYEIFDDGHMDLVTTTGESITGHVDKNDAFDIKNISISIDINGEPVIFAYQEANEQFDAAHAMGTYTLSLYDEDVFVIRGVDGFVKAMGTMTTDSGNGQAEYFPREITGEAESTDAYKIAFSKDDNTYYFPDNTPLLPRSGNIDNETGTGSYWNAGTTLEFIRRSETAMQDPQDLFEQNAEYTGNNLPDTSSELKAIMPSTGIAKPLVLLIDFPDFHRPRHVTPEGIERALFSLDEPDSLCSFYYMSSYGKLTIDGSVYGWYRTKQNRSDYSSDTEIMAEAINHYLDTDELSLSDYDSDGDGSIDALYVLWAGNMTGGDGMWDSAYRSTWQDSPSGWDKKVTGYIFVPGITIWSSVPPLKCNTNSLIHETGHLLGLNDYYSYDTSDRVGMDGNAYTGGAFEGGLGGMDMMDTNIGDHNIFSKYLLGWVEPEIIEADRIKDLKDEKYVLRPSCESPDGLFIKLKGSDSLNTEMFVIEAVKPEGNFAEYSRLTEPVVRIIHVENEPVRKEDKGNWRSFGFRYDNSYTSTKYIRILEADGKDEVNAFVPSSGADKISYSEEDYFKAGDVISPDTYPNTNSDDIYGNPSVHTGLEITVEQIEDDGTAHIKLSYKEPAESLKLISSEPEPAVVPYDAEQGGLFNKGEHEITFSFDRPVVLSDSYKEDMIYIVSGNKIIENVDAVTEGGQLKVVCNDGFESGKEYRVVIKPGALCSSEDSSCINDYFGIFGFICR